MWVTNQNLREKLPDRRLQLQWGNIRAWSRWLRRGWCGSNYKTPSTSNRELPPVALLRDRYRSIQLPTTKNSQQAYKQSLKSCVLKQANWVKAQQTPRVFIKPITPSKKIQYRTGVNHQMFTGKPKISQSIKCQIDINPLDSNASLTLLI